jgi:hypothetical protein
MNEENMKDYNMSPLGLGNSRISAGYAQKSPHNFFLRNHNYKFWVERSFFCYAQILTILVDLSERIDICHCNCIL